MARRTLADERSLENAFKHMIGDLSVSNAAVDWADPVDFIMSYFYTFDTEKLLELYPCQIEPLRHALRRDENGDFYYDTIIWSWPKKSAKSIVAAGVLDWMAYHIPNAQIRVLSNDLKQAVSRVGAYLVRNIEIAREKGYIEEPTDYMHEYRLNTIIDQSNTRIRYPNGATIEMIPLDFKGEAGGNDSAVSVGELWAWDTERHVNMWTETTPPPTKFGKSLRFVDTYAGMAGRSIVLEPLYDELVNKGNKISFPNNEECYENGRMFGTWVTKHLLSWQLQEYYDSQKKSLDASEYNRIHHNMWSSGYSPFISISDWDANALDTVKYTTEDVFVSLDAGRSSDGFAITVGCRLQDNLQNIPYLMEICNKHKLDPDTYIAYLLIESHIWYPADNGGKLKYSGYDGSPMSVLQELNTKYPIYVVTYDEYQLAHFVDEAENEIAANFEAFSQGVEREKSDKHLRDIITGHMLVHNGKHSEVRQHLINSDVKPSSEGNRIRIQKRSKSSKVDLAVSMSMLFWKVREYMVGN